jgi:hypothetical protein
MSVSDREIKRMNLQFNVLQKIAEGNKAFYDLKDFGSNSSIYKVLDKLIRGKFILQGETGSRNRKPYYLTKRGLFFILSTSQKMSANMISSQKHFLPLIFGKWDKLRRFGLEDWVSDTLPYAVRQAETNIFSDTVTIQTSDEEYLTRYNENHDRVIHRSVYGPFIGFTNQMLKEYGVPIKKLKRLFQNDQEIRDYFISTLESDKKDLEMRLESLDVNKQIFAI